MDFDFYQEYKNYSTLDLLKIVKRTADYQPAAVAVATAILNKRQITTEEMELVDQYFKDIDDATRIQKEKIDALKGKAIDSFEGLLYPSETVESKKWIKALLVAVALQYAWLLLTASGN